MNERRKKKMVKELITATVPYLPDCSFFSPTDSPCEKAEYDGKTTLGPWAYLCKRHFKIFGIGLGLGKGQRLIVPPSKKGGKDMKDTSTSSVQSPASDPNVWKKPSVNAFLDVLFERDEELYQAVFSQTRKDGRTMVLTVMANARQLFNAITRKLTIQVYRQAPAS